MALIRTLRSVFTADPTGFIKGANAVEAKLQSTMKSLDRSKASFMTAFSKMPVIGNIGGQLAGIAAGAVGVATAMKAVKTGFETAADIEQFDIAFETLLKSSEKAKKLRQDLVSFAAETPFRMGETFEGAQKLIAQGVDLNQIIPTLSKLGDIAAGTKSELSELVAGYNKALSKGKLQADVLRMDVFEKTPIVATMAMQKFGDSTDASKQKIFALAEAGQLFASDMQKAIKELTDEGGLFFGMWKKQGQTLAGLWSTLADTLDITLGKAAQVIVDKLDLKKAMKDGIAAIENFAATSLPKFADWVADVWQRMKSVGMAIKSGFDIGVKAVGTFIASLTGVGERIAKMFTGGELTQFVTDFAATFATVFSNLPGIVEVAFLKISAALQHLGADIMEQVANFASSIDKLSNDPIMRVILGGKGSNLTPGLVKEAQGIRGGAAITGMRATAAEQALGAAMPRQFQEFQGLFGKMIGNLKDAISPPAGQEGILDPFKMLAGAKDVIGGAVVGGIKDALAVPFKIGESMAAAEPKKDMKVELPPAALAGTVEAYRIAMRSTGSINSVDKKIENNTGKTADKVDDLLQFARNAGVILLGANLGGK